MSSFPSAKRHFIFFAVGAGVAALALLVYMQVREAPLDTQQAQVQQEPPGESQAQEAEQASHWTVGELRSNGLRIRPSGRSDASAVLDPDRFDRPEVRRSYEIAMEIPEVLNQLYCWCGCENRGVHRSNLGCFEDEMAVNCDVCRGTAEIASRMTEEGVTDAGKIQAAVDEEWGPEWAHREQENRQKES